MTAKPAQYPLVTTIGERCRVCYTCVRECPAKAIRITGGQAEVMVERCIGCGNCVKVCSQEAKQVLSDIDRVYDLLASDHRVSACIAPSFPAEFYTLDCREFVGRVRALGFDYVHEVAFGADLVAEQYRQLTESTENKQYIAGNCPAIIEYICRFHPGLVDSLAPVVSPMLATARALRSLLGNDLKIVFLGPCIAKKGEHDPLRPVDEIDAVITFIELNQIFHETGMDAKTVETSDFDEPHSHRGSLFPISRGMLQTAHINDDLIPGNVVAADGRKDFVEAIKEFETGDLRVKLLETLCCNGCIMGPGMSSRQPLFRRRSHVINYFKKRQSHLNRSQWETYKKRLSGLDLSRGYQSNDQCFSAPPQGEIDKILKGMGKTSTRDELNCGACGYHSCREHAVAIYQGIAESEMCLPYSIDQLKKILNELSVSHQELASVQEALMHSERLASMGQLAAGIAHEINNPLGIVLMYAHLLLDECDPESGLNNDIKMIVEQTDRCKQIVAGLLNFARQNKVNRQSTDVLKLVEQSLRTVLIPATVTVRVIPKCTDLLVELDANQITQVLTNLMVNACESMPDGGRLDIEIADEKDQICFSVKDTGIGIPPDIRTKIFEPFFTTKQMGKGTGLGLAVTYGIVKMHGGDIRFESNCDPDCGPTGTTFFLTLPRQPGTISQNGRHKPNSEFSG
ncbi:MAG: [Fe-Fe] hydrogenase large subunit C-terminal domain-containing protein [bacterium]